MVRMLSVNIYPLLRIVKRYNLDQDLFFRIILNFLSHRREEILNVQLSKWFSSFEISLKSEMKPIIYELLSELDYSDNVEDYFILNGRFYIKENPDATEPE
ncbi:hypothetical protein YUBABA_02160 [Serratia phage vB_SmaM-Yubaba]|nr:hypothetical protein SUREIYA_00190 [Serratia phage vB_SmaM-Sureiya]UQT03418.1 hypothetical protein YUBABA_02160 [Serratia phage vB_SmaM-Yubaba]